MNIFILITTSYNNPPFYWAHGWGLVIDGHLFVVSSAEIAQRVA